jgi:hypothetical protein
LGGEVFGSNLVQNTGYHDIIIFVAFLSLSRKIAGIIPRLGHDGRLPDSLQFIIHSSYHSTLCRVSLEERSIFWSIVHSKKKKVDMNMNRNAPMCEAFESV